MAGSASVRRTHRISWAPSGWFVDVSNAEACTDLLTLCCADEFFAVRVGFVNTHPEPYAVQRVIAAASSTLGDFVNPTGEAAWTALTFAGGGKPSERVVDPAGAPTVMTVHGRLTGIDLDPGVPSWTWTDWAPIRSLRRTDRPGAPPVLMLRVLFPASTRSTRPNGSFAEYYKDAAANGGLTYVAGHAPRDAVTSPQKLSGPACCLGNWFSPIACVQFLTARAGVVCMTTGDSHHQGTSTTTQFLNYLLRAVAQIAPITSNRGPIGYWSTARGGADSSYFFDAMASVLDLAQPGFVVLPGWSYNDARGGVHDTATADLFYARLLMAAEQCRDGGARPLILTPFPRDRRSMGKTEMEAWLSLRSRILGLSAQGHCVVDAGGLLGRSSEGAYDGTYRPEFSDDGIHPNDAGHAAIAARLVPLLVGAGSW